MPQPRLAVADGPRQAEALAARFPRGAPGLEVLAVGADAELILEKAGFKPLAPEAFFSAEDCRPVKVEAYRRAERLCAELDRLAREAWPDLPEAFQPFHAQLFSIRHLVDHAFFTAWRLRRAAAARPGSRLVRFETRPEPIKDDLFYREESIWSRAAALVAPEADVLPPTAALAAPSLSARLKAAARGWRRRWAAAFAPRPPAGAWVFLNRGYSTGALADEARRRGETAAFLDPELLEPVRPDRRLVGALEPAWAAFAASSEAKTLLSWEGLDLSPLVLPRLSRLALSVAPRSAGLYRAAANAIAERRPKALAAATMNWREKIVSQAAKAAGVPFAVYVHGNIGTRHSEIIRYNDLDYSDLYLVNGEAQAAYCRATFPGTRARAVPVGSAALDRLASRLKTDRADAKRALGFDPARPLIVYALSGVRDFRFPQYHRTSHANFALQRAVAAVAAAHPGCDVLFKDYGSNVEQAPIGRFIRGLGAPHVRVIEQPPFSRLLPAADAFIADFPSTTLCEMALTDRTIFFLDALSTLDWLPDAKEAVRRRCVFIDDLSKLEPELSARLREGRFEPNPDQTYLKGWGTHLGDGKSLSRAWEALAALGR